MSAAIAVVIPCYQVARTIAAVVAGIGPEARHIFCVDDASTDASAEIIAGVAAADPRVRLIRRPENGGVGAAVLDGYRAALGAGCGIIVKLDGDGQSDPALLAKFCRPIQEGRADYVKGNRFYFPDKVQAMPLGRILGNAGLSFLTKLSTGYWDLFDPTNGYTAIHADVAAALPFARLHRRYFFESDMLFRLAVIRARVVELPMESVYGAETSHLGVWRCLVTFPGLHLRNLVKRIGYNYFLRNFSIASVNLVLGLALIAFGLIFGLDHWLASVATGRAATAGTVMVSALPILIGVQMGLSFLAFDIAMTPREPLQGHLADLSLLAGAGDGPSGDQPS